MANIDVLVGEEAFPLNATLAAFLDSLYYVDIASYDPSFPGFQYQEQQKYRLFNTTRILSAPCTAAYPDPADQWKCQFGQYRMPFVTTRYLVLTAQFDGYQLPYLTGVGSTSQYNASVTAYAVEFGNLTVTEFTALSQSNAVTGPPRARVVNGFYSWACYNHDVSDSATFYDGSCKTNDNITMNDALRVFLNTTGASKDAQSAVTSIDHCSGYACGTYCGNNK